MKQNKFGQYRYRKLYKQGASGEPEGATSGNNTPRPYELEWSLSEWQSACKTKAEQTMAATDSSDDSSQRRSQVYEFVGGRHPGACGIGSPLSAHESLEISAEKLPFTRDDFEHPHGAHYLNRSQIALPTDEQMRNEREVKQLVARCPTSCHTPGLTAP